MSDTPRTDAQYGCEGMTLRDYFAAKLPREEIDMLSYHNLSVLAKEKITGMKKPSKENYDSVIDYQIDCTKFAAVVNAKLRFIASDAMIAARKEASHE